MGYRLQRSCAGFSSSTFTAAAMAARRILARFTPVSTTTRISSSAIAAVSACGEAKTNEATGARQTSCIINAPAGPGARPRCPLSRLRARPIHPRRAGLARPRCCRNLSGGCVASRSTTTPRDGGCGATRDLAILVVPAARLRSAQGRSAGSVRSDPATGGRADRDDRRRAIAVTTPQGSRSSSVG